MKDSFFMRRCIELARLGAGNVAPNPMVGAVLVHEGEIIGEGYHQKYGGPHAEVNCVESVPSNKKEQISQSRLFVSLEPCNHFGKTPPCTELILRNKIPEVIIGCIDKNSVVSGKGVQRLRDAGVKVMTGVLEEECISLNKRFFTSKVLKRPYIILKWAQTSNGVMGTKGNRLHISNDYTNTLVQRWRSHEQAILVGAGTATADDPSLTNRYGSGEQPLRIVLCQQTPKKNLKMFGLPGKTIVFNTEVEDAQGNVVWKKVNQSNYLNEMLSILDGMNIQSVLVEGGSFTLQRFFNAGLWDECRVIINTKMVSEGSVKSPILPSVNLMHTEMILEDNVQYFVNPQNNLVVRNEISDYF